MKSEFAALSDLAMATGVKHSDLIAEIHDLVLTKFRQRYPKQPPGVAVVVDEVTGVVRIYSGEKDITPDDFAEEAASLARQVIIDKLGSAPKPESKSGVSVISGQILAKKGAMMPWITNLFFWGYNIYFLLFTLFAQIGWLSGMFAGNIWENIKNIDVLQMLMGWILLLTPAVSMWVALRRKLYEKPGAMGRIFFLFEIPVFIIAMIPSMLGEQTSLFMQFVVVILLGIPLILYYYALDTDPGVLGKKVMLFIQQAAFAVVAYLTLLFSFFVPLILGEAGKGLFGDLMRTFTYDVSYRYYYHPSVIETAFQFGFALLIFSFIVILISLPYLLVYVLVKALRKTHAGLAETMPQTEFVRLQVIYGAIIVLIAGLTTIQFGNQKQLDLLGQIIDTDKFAAQEEIVKQIYPDEKKIADMIKNQDDVRYRYWLTRDDTTLSDGYEMVFGTDSFVAEAIQKVFLSTAYPFVYQGKYYSSYDLDTQFRYVFGHSVYETKATTPRTPTNVKLTYRKYDMTTDSSGVSARISIEEEYENTNTAQQEVIYEFSLPDGSVVTELNLGPNLEYPGVIAPKGAAQRTYEAQLQVRRDPALLEQVGPNQYRLRVFPIPGYNDFTTLRGKRQKVQYAYVTPITPQGFGLPDYYKTTNLLINNFTTYLVVKNGGPSEFGKEGMKYLTWNTMGEVCKTDLTTTVDTAKVSGQLTANPSPACSSDSDVLNFVSGKRVGIFFDISPDNKNSQVLADLKKVLAEKKDFLTSNTVDFYKYNQQLSDPAPLTPQTLDQATSTVFFGTSNMLKALASLKEKYDLVLIVPSPKASFANSMNYPFNPATPVYVIQGGERPAYDMKFVTFLLQGNGGAEKTITEAVRDFAIKNELNKASRGIIVQPVGRYFNLALLATTGADELLLGSRAASGSANTHPALVNSVLWKSKLKKTMTDVTGNVSGMDQFNNFAQEAGIVTPFSSYIALVNEQQRQQLEQFKDSYNRYQDQNMTTATNVVTPRPMFDELRFESQPRIMNPMMGLGATMFGGGPDLIQMDLKGIGDGGSAISGGGGIAMAPSAPRYSALSSFSLGNSAFFLLNGAVLGLGMVWYLVKLIKKPKKSN